MNKNRIRLPFTIFHGHTIRGRLLFLAIVVEVVMLSILVFNSLRLLHGAMTNQARSQAEQFYPVLKAALTAPLAQQDYATVQAVVNESRTAGGVDYIVVVDRSDKRVGSSGLSPEQPLPEPSSNLLLFNLKKEPCYDVVVPIHLNDQLLGRLHFGLNLSQIVSARHVLLTQEIIIATVEIVLSSLIMTLIGYWLTRHLTSLTRASREIALGNMESQMPEGDDDVGQLGVAFNTMSRIISERVNELTAAKVAAEASEQLILQSGEQLQKLNEELEQRVENEVLKNRAKDSLLLQQDKLASIGQLAAGVAHEINNPMGFITSNLTTLKGYVENLAQFTALLQTLVSKDCSDKEVSMVGEVSKKLDIAYILNDIRALIAESTEGAERVKQIVLDLKDFAHVDENGLDRTNLNRCVESTLNMVRNEIKYVADIVLKLGEIPEIICSANQINQVITNLLVNAGHAIEKHGTITVSTYQEGEQVVLTISDTGKGMTDEIRKRIFEPFFSTKEVGKGTGLGLTISYDIIQKHGGEILVESKPGIGTTFTIKLPIKNEQEVSA